MRKITTFLILFLASNAFAKSGNELHDLIQNNRHDAIYYIQGVMDSQAHRLEYDEVVAKIEKKTIDRHNYVCIPNGTTYGQAFDIIKNYLQANPAERNNNASSLIFWAFIEVWRCQ